ncbi:hypothetical protein QUB21_18285 [Microcoleus sp. AT9b-C4]
MADAPRGPQLVIGAGRGRIKQMLWNQSTAVVLPAACSDIVSG